MKIKLNKLSVIFFVILISVILPATSVSTQSVRSFESPWELDELKDGLKIVLEKVYKEKYHEEEKTDGFSYHYKSDFFSAYNYSIYIGKIFTDKKNTILRIEGNDGDANNISRILDLEGIINKNASLGKELQNYKMSEKYHSLAQPLNILSPSLSVLYQSYQSPRLGKEQGLSRALNYLLLDVLAYWIGGNLLFTTSHNPQENKEPILIWMSLNRAYGAAQSYNIVKSHNHLLRFNYTFPIQ